MEKKRKKGCKKDEISNCHTQELIKSLRKKRGENTDERRGPSVVKREKKRETGRGKRQPKREERRGKGKKDCYVACGGFVREGATKDWNYSRKRRGMKKARLGQRGKYWGTVKKGFMVGNKKTPNEGPNSVGEKTEIREKKREQTGGGVFLGRCGQRRA